jgi:SpoIID/LytB domain protein
VSRRWSESGRGYRSFGLIGILVLSALPVGIAGATPEPDEDFALPGSVVAGAGRPVRVRMVGRLGGAPALTVTPEGPCRVVDAATGQALAEIAAGEAWEVTTAENRVRAAPASASGASATAATLRFESGMDMGLRVGTGRAAGSRAASLLLPGVLEVTRGQRGLAVVNEAPLEPYILGVVAAEGPASFHPEALKALAVAARSYTECNRGRHGGGTDLCDTTHCHAYAGIGRAAASVRAAVAATAGIVALYDGRPIDAVYSADCGGRTQTPDDAWGSRRRAIPYLRSVLDSPAEGEAPYCAVNPRRGWQIALPLATLRRRLGWGEAQLWEAAVGATNGSGRATRILLKGGAMPPPAEGTPVSEVGVPTPLPVDAPSGTLLQSATPSAESAGPGASSVTRELTLAQFRELIRPHALPGRYFRLSLGPSELRIEGAGLGHGVGLCQYGAHGMALQGNSYEAILKHYYAGIDLGLLAAMPSGG